MKEVTIERREFVFAGAAAVASALLGNRPGAGNPQAEAEKKKKTGEKAFSFAFITDAHLAPNLGSVRQWELPAPRETLTETPFVGYKRVLREIERRSIDFIVTGGDDVELHTYELPPIDGILPVTENFDALDKCVKKMTEIEKAVGVPFFHTMGNHQSFEYPPATPDHPLYGEGWFIKYWGVEGRAYYSFDKGGWHFIVLSTHDKKEKNSREWCGFSDRQIEWLDADLKKTGRERPVVLVAHVPYDEERIKPDFERVARTLKGYNVKLGLCGHEHGYREFTWHGIPCVVGSSLSGAVWSAVRNVVDSACLPHMDQGYLVLDVSEGEISWRHYPFTYSIEKYYFEHTGKRPYAKSDYWCRKKKK